MIADFFAGGGQVVIYDANNGTRQARQAVAEKFAKEGIHVVYLGALAGPRSASCVCSPTSFWLIRCRTSPRQNPCVITTRSSRLISGASRYLRLMWVLLPYLQLHICNAAFSTAAGTQRKRSPIIMPASGTARNGMNPWKRRRGRTFVSSMYAPCPLPPMPQAHVYAPARSARKSWSM